MPDNKHYITLRINPGSSKQEIKRAYRRLAMMYHPDRNSTAIASKRFQEITEAYNALTTDKPAPEIHTPYKRDPSYARESREARASKEARERSHQAKVKAEYQKKQKAAKKEAFKKSKLYDIYLFSQYFLRLLALIFSIAAIVTPFVLAILIEPVVLAATFFFVIIGSFLLWHIISKKETWFKLGKFNTTSNVIKEVFKKPTPQRANGFCYYSNARASGKPYKVGLVRVLDTRRPFFGRAKKQPKIKRKSMNVIIPRSARAQYIHKICAFTRLSIIILSMLFLPVSSLIWRIAAGIFLAAFTSSMIMLITRVKAKATYLYTPAFLIKLVIWVAALYSISYFGPGLEVELSGYKYIVIAGLVFLLDMIFDLLTGIFPFYRKLFTPITKQGKVLTGYYKDGFQNYIEYPVISIIYPLYLWLF